MTEIPNDLDLGWCTGASAKDLVVVRGREPLRYALSLSTSETRGVGKFSLSEMIAKHNRFTARLKTTAQDLSNLHHYLHNMERLRHDGRYVRIRQADDR
jgi:hypothetical protein